MNRDLQREVVFGKPFDLEIINQSPEFHNHAADFGVNAPLDPSCAVRLSL